MVPQTTDQAEADAATQGDEIAVEVNEARCTNGGSTSHIGKNKLSKIEWTALPQPRLREWMLMNKLLKRGACQICFMY